jgi:hypothetical protein
MVHARARFIDRGGNWSVELERALSLPGHQSPGAPQILPSSPSRADRSTGVPHVRTSVRGPKTMAEPATAFSSGRYHRFIRTEAKRSAIPPPKWICDTRCRIERDTCGIPHLAKNERDVGHPATGDGDRAQKRVHSEGWESVRMFSVGAFNVEACARRDHPSLLPQWTRPDQLVRRLFEHRLESDPLLESAGAPRP